ncbi:exodeoxyribonuclease VII small subunit [Candidatus Venteria ishoeyi]|uniref:Exodeoxyribonuclease 7 small subunit n=1 Tax=Candidatus Venteria ishoeyi TaxID=1899563 RepID=A0A1H6FAH5_9GAMM|nr:exodeoxyribonuclease VII small subunit [Candidatus Venteria ishoeyi]MDM8546623.1 exodeoxyribonuclease VII small subunit [Candidatus Venteria ishoeyi]SEH06034.1 Exodeoxyribonuclease 7 small subunit [Candidatus Venteria ishoeyi]
MPKRAINLEKSLRDLETLVTKMESGDLSLEESLKLFERGIQLTRQSQQALNDAEQKVEILINDHMQTFPLNPDTQFDKVEPDAVAKSDD